MGVEWYTRTAGEKNSYKQDYSNWTRFWRREFPRQAKPEGVLTTKSIILTGNVKRSFSSRNVCVCICCSVAQSCLIFCDPVDWSTPDFVLFYHLLELAQTHVHWVCDAIQPSHPLSSLSPPTFNLSQIRALSNESALHIGWPKYCSFHFSISPSNEYSGLSLFVTDWFDLLAVQRTLKSLL